MALQNVPKFVALADQIQADIAKSKFSVGGKLPSYRALSERYGVAYLTLRR